MPLEIKKGKPKAAESVSNSVSDEKAKAAATAQAQASVEDKVPQDVIGSKCDTLHFVAPLEDPSIDDVTPIKVNGEIKDLKTGTIIGYRFKSTEPITVPDCGLDAGFKQDKMNYVNAGGTRQVKAGEKFDLTPFEAACLLSQPQYNGEASGGDYPVKCVYHMQGAKKKDGSTVKVSDANQIPRVSLRGLKTQIKCIPMIPVLTCESVKNPNGTTTKNRTIIPGFEKWKCLCERSVRTGAGAGAKAATNKYNANAQTFLNIVNAKKK